MGNIPPLLSLASTEHTVAVAVAATVLLVLSYLAMFISSEGALSFFLSD